MNRQLLEQPFDSKFIRQRKGNFGHTLDYLETHVVIQRLNDAFDGTWSFEIVTHEQIGDEVVVLGKLTAENVTKMQFGSSKVTRAKGSDEVICIGDDLKSAASDALKKVATLLGVGLHLYGSLPASDADGDAASAGAEADKSGMSTMSQNRGNDLISKQQLAQVKKLRTQLGWTPEELQDRADRLFATREITTLNSTMGAALVAYLQNQPGNGGK